MSAQTETIGGTGVRFVHDIERQPQPHQAGPRWKDRKTPKKEGTMFKCPDCPRTFETPNALGPHRRVAHGYRAKGPEGKPPNPARVKERTTSKPYPCPQAGCTFTTSNRYAFSGHMKGHKTPPGRGAGPSGQRNLHAGVKNRSAAPAHFERLLARLKAKQDELDAAIETLEKVEGLLA